MQYSNEHLSEPVRSAWWKLCVVYRATKKLYLRAEELDPEFKTFMQPIGELRDANDHVMRAMSVRMGLEAPPTTDSVEDYVVGSLTKALGHTYRCFFDTADWLSIALRERFLAEVEPFTNDCMDAVWPNYYTEVRPQVDSVRTAIEAGKFREAKDVCKNDIIKDVEAYMSLIEGFISNVEEAERRQPALREWIRRHRREEKHQWIKQSLLGGGALFLLFEAVKKLLF